VGSADSATRPDAADTSSSCSSPLDRADKPRVDISVGTLIASLLVGSIGLGLFLSSRRAFRVPQLVSGVALMAIPCLFDGCLLIYALAALVLVGLWLAVRAGM
jgi:hypothetical protein